MAKGPESNDAERPGPGPSGSCEGGRGVKPINKAPPAPEDDEDAAWDDFDPDSCFICDDGGDLLCCDYCERAYHLECHNPRLSSVPEGKWKCMECTALSRLLRTSRCGSCPGCDRTTDCGKCPPCIGASTSKPTTTGAGDHAGCELRLCTNTNYTLTPARESKKRKQRDDGTVYKGTRIAKKFDGVAYFGTIIGRDETSVYWHIRYDDGDEEDYDERDVDRALQCYEANKDKDPNPKIKATEAAGDDGLKKRETKESPGSDAAIAANATEKKQGKDEKLTSIKRRTVSEIMPRRPSSESRRVDSTQSGNQNQAGSREERQTAPLFCAVEVPKGVSEKDRVYVKWPNGRTTQVDCPPGVEYSPYMLVVAPAGMPPVEAKVVARDNASQLNHGLEHGYLRPSIVGAFTDVLWPALKIDGWRMIDARESNTGTIFFVPRGVDIRDRKMVLGRDYFRTYNDVLHHVAKMERFSGAFKAFEKDAEMRKAAARKKAAEKRRLKRLEEEKHYLSKRPEHDTPVGPDHQVTRLPAPGTFSVSEAQKCCDDLWDPKCASSATYKFLDDLRGKKSDMEAAMEMIRSMNYSVDGIEEIMTKSEPPEAWSEQEKQRFCAEVRKNRHDIKGVANCIGKSLECCLWYYYHLYRAQSHWNDEKRLGAFHTTIIDKKKDLKKTSDSMGLRLDSCLFYYYSSYRSSENYKALKEAMKAEEETDVHDDYCAICDDGGDLICCHYCPSSYHLDCASLEAVPDGDWKCMECEGKISAAPIIDVPSNALALSVSVGSDGGKQVVGQAEAAVVVAGGETETDVSGGPLISPGNNTATTSPS